MKYFLQRYWVFILWLLLAACANIVTPSGGPKDTTPPVVVKTTPPLYSKHFTGNTARIDFDKFVKLTDPSSQIVVSPFMKETPDTKVKGKSIIMTFHHDTLKKNTTYSITFGKSIADVNEGNVLQNFRYVFSTGDSIDSLALRGIIKNAFSCKPESGVFVMLYNKNLDSLPYKEYPFYVAKTNEAGEFYFSNLKKDSYKIFCLKNDNNSYLFDQSTAKIAFLDSLITPEIDYHSKADSTKKNTRYELFLFEESPTKQRLLKSYSHSTGKIVFVFRKQTGDISFTPLNKNSIDFGNTREINKTKDTITLWLKDTKIDSLTLLVRENNIILDTAVIALHKKSSKSIKPRGIEIKNTGIKAVVTNNGTFDFYKPFSFETTAPLSEYDFSKIIFVENKDTIKAKFHFEDSIKKTIVLTNKLKEETAYSCFISPATFKDITGFSNDTFKLSFTTTSAKMYGTISVKITSHNNSCQHIIQLVDDNDVVAQEKIIQSGIKLNFVNVKPGNYRMKVICDANSNGKWDTGNYLKHIQPEKVSYYSTNFAIKANWESEFSWDITE